MVCHIIIFLEIQIITKFGAALACVKQLEFQRICCRRWEHCCVTQFIARKGIEWRFIASERRSTSFE